MRTIALILARGGSKRFPRKNLALFQGQTLVARAINCARQVSAIERIILSTDDAEIAEEGRRHGADVPFLRPPELAEDSTSSEAAALHALSFLSMTSGTVVLLQPTSPLRTPDDVTQALEFKARHNLPSVVSVGPDGELNGAIYAIDVDVLTREKHFNPACSAKWPMPASRSVDVDYPDDLARAGVVGSDIVFPADAVKTG